MKKTKPQENIEGKRYIQIDSDSYFANFYTIDETAKNDDVLIAWTETGGSAADGYDVPIIPKDQLIPPDVIFAVPPKTTELLPNINNFKWSGEVWAYEHDK